MLCCSYNFNCGDDAPAVGYDGLVASSTSVARHTSNAHSNQTQSSDNIRQYSAALQTTNSSADIIDISDSGGNNKTDRPGGWILPAWCWFNIPRHFWATCAIT